MVNPSSELLSPPPLLPVVVLPPKKPPPKPPPKNWLFAKSLFPPALSWGINTSMHCRFWTTCPLGQQRSSTGGWSLAQVIQPTAGSENAQLAMMSLQLSSLPRYWFAGQVFCNEQIPYDSLYYGAHSVHSPMLLTLLQPSGFWTQMPWILVSSSRHLLLFLGNLHDPV